MLLLVKFSLRVFVAFQVASLSKVASAFCKLQPQSPSMLSAWLQLAYNETSEGTLGPFNVEARLTSVGGSVLYATGSGRVSPPANIVTILFQVLYICKGIDNS